MVGSLHADTMLDRTESSSPGEGSTRRPAVLAGMLAVMLLKAATLGVFKGSA